MCALNNMTRDLWACIPQDFEVDEKRCGYDKVYEEAVEYLATHGGDTLSQELFQSDEEYAQALLIVVLNLDCVDVTDIMNGGKSQRQAAREALIDKHIPSFE